MNEGVFVKLYVITSGPTIAIPEEVLCTSCQPQSSRTFVPIPSLAYLIDHPEGWVLFDTGWSNSKENILLQNMADIGVGVEDIRYVICSHLHEDHSKNLSCFRNSEILISDTEFTNVAKLFCLNKLFPPYIKEDVEEWLHVGLNWKLIREKKVPVKLMDGIYLLSFGAGHAFGMLGLLVKLSKTGNVILASDAIYSQKNLGPPLCLPGHYNDLDGYLKTLEALQELAVEYQAHLWFGHDMEQAEELVKTRMYV